MAILRIIAWILVALGFMLLGADAISTAEMGTPVVRTTAEIIDLFGPKLTPGGDGPVGAVSKFILEAPLWTLVGIVGMLMTLIFRPVD